MVRARAFFALLAAVPVGCSSSRPAVEEGKTTAAPIATQVPSAEASSPPATPPKQSFWPFAKLTGPNSGNVLVAAVDGAVFLHQDSYSGSRMFRVAEEGIIREALDTRLPLVEIVGRWPDRTYALSWSPDIGGRAYTSWFIHRLDGTTWKEVETHKDPNNVMFGAGGTFMHGAPLLQGDRLVGVFQTYEPPSTMSAEDRNNPFPSFDRRDYMKLTLTVLDGAKAVPPKFVSRKVDCTPANEVIASAVEATTDGIVVGGDRCNGEGPAIQRLAANDSFPISFAEGCRFEHFVYVDVDRADVLVRCNKDETKLMRVTAKARDTTIASGPIAMKAPRAAEMLPDGSGYFVESETLHRVDKDGGHRELALPPGVELLASGTDYAVDSSGDFWIVAGDTVWRSRPPKGEVQEFEWPADNAQLSAPLRRPSAASDRCESIYVVMYGFTKVTPDDYDFPLTRKALKGHTELATAKLVVTREGNQKYFGAFVPDMATAKKLAKVIKEGVEGSSPQIVCAKPEVLREVKVDLRTGEVAK